MDIIITPYLSEKDDAEGGDSSIYPLGLNIIADSLATKLAPGVRERQSTPRFLTAMAVSSIVCQNFPEYKIAKDGKSEPWQIFEWYVVEGLVRKCPKDEKKKLARLPGIEKAENAINRDSVPLSAKRYLVKPSVYGFHGVYRVLADELGIIKENTICETGYNLVRAWEQENNLNGFISNQVGNGVDFRKQMYEAIKDGIEVAETKRTGGWTGWELIYKYLMPHEIGNKEAKVIKDCLLDSKAPLRKQTIQNLISEEGQKAWKKTHSERDFHKVVFKNADAELKDLLDAIFKYEMFSRLVEDSFDDCLLILSKKYGKISSNELANSLKRKDISKQVKNAFLEASTALKKYNDGIRFNDKFGRFGSDQSLGKFIENLMDHHIQVQRDKPPSGKSPWIVRVDNNTYIIKPAYRVEEGGKHDNEYVHYYRTNSLWSFSIDLKWVKENV